MCQYSTARFLRKEDFHVVRFRSYIDKKDNSCKTELSTNCSNRRLNFVKLFSLNLARKIVLTIDFAKLKMKQIGATLISATEPSF